jgi:hypothetical protein
MDLIAINDDPLDPSSHDAAGLSIPGVRGGISGQIVPAQRAAQGFDRKPLYVIGHDTGSEPALRSCINARLM